jgi:NTP pyrophosphatase (non-canonical NTP hydrolase)
MSRERVDRVAANEIKERVMNEQETPQKELTLSEFQRLIRKMYVEKDIERGFAGTFMWLIEEVGELATALRNGTLRECEEEFADVLAWLTTIANIVGVDLNKALLDKYGAGCPGCGKLVCDCPDYEKP